MHSTAIILLAVTASLQLGAAIPIKREPGSALSALSKDTSSATKG